MPIALEVLSLKSVLNFLKIYDLHVLLWVYLSKILFLESPRRL